MWYLFLQIWVWLIAAFALGWLAHWFLCCRNKEQDNVALNSSEFKSSTTTNTVAPAATVAAVAAPAAALNVVDDSWKPVGFMERPTDVDDLKRIKGIGAVIEKTLNGLGIYQFGQISKWDDDNAAWVDSFLSFSGRIGRENWISQAKTLGAGGTTEFAAKVDKGDVDYKS